MPYINSIYRKLVTTSIKGVSHLGWGAIGMPPLKDF